MHQSVLTGSYKRCVAESGFDVQNLLLEGCEVEDPGASEDTAEQGFLFFLVARILCPLIQYYGLVCFFHREACPLALSFSTLLYISHPAFVFFFV